MIDPSRAVKKTTTKSSDLIGSQPTLVFPMSNPKSRALIGQLCPAGGVGEECCHYPHLQDAHLWDAAGAVAAAPSLKRMRTFSCRCCITIRKDAAAASRFESLSKPSTAALRDTTARNRHATAHTCRTKRSSHELVQSISHRYSIRLSHNFACIHPLTVFHLLGRRLDFRVRYGFNSRSDELDVSFTREWCKTQCDPYFQIRRSFHISTTLLDI